MPRIGVIQFPGSNCEYETQRAVEYFGMSAKIIRWNISQNEFNSCDGFVLPGGFSYQDRIRSGAIAARLPILNALFEANKIGKPILGICNGCQILCETGLVPNIDKNGDATHAIEATLTHNEIGGQRIGFTCEWVYVKANNPSKSLFTRYFDASDVIPIPINHGEGRFVIKESLIPHLDSLANFQYCDSTGAVTSAANPNGTFRNIAGLTNTTGNVMALMPHPERASLRKQIPDWISSHWANSKTQELLNNRTAGPWEKLLVSLKDYISQAGYNS